MKFEGRLSISVLKNRVALYKKSKAENRKV
jgi:hypothetical protein